MSQELNTLTAFLKGYKPAFLCNVDDVFAENIKIQLLSFPHILSMNMGHALQNIYFRNQLFKEHFLKRIDGLNSSTPAFYYELGLALGYPEKASRFYKECEMDQDLKWFRIGVDFCGIEFVCYFEDLIDIVDELLKLPIPEHEDRTVAVHYYGNYPLSPEFRYRLSNKIQLKCAQEELRIIANYRRSNE